MCLQGLLQIILTVAQIDQVNSMIKDTELKGDIINGFITHLFVNTLNWLQQLQITVNIVIHLKY